MIISYNWLLQYVKCDLPLEELCSKVTMAGLEVEGITPVNQIPQGVVAAKILERVPHPNSDHMSICRVFDGKEELQIVCGAPNCDAGKTVPCARIGTVFSTPDGDFTIKKAKLRGVESFGMLCAADEIGVGNDHDGLLILPDDILPGSTLEKLFPPDWMIEMEVTPNRPDWLSHWGVARDIAALTGAPAALPTVVVPADNSMEQIKGLVTVEADDLCRRYIGKVIENVKIAESPDWLKERLRAVGLRPINNVVDVTNFVLMELGQPLHAFDRDLLAEGRVVVRRAKDGEKIRTLDGSEVELASKHLVIADAEKPMALAGIMGGEYSGVRDTTTTVLLESAVFDPSNIRATSRELGISSDSSYRFERGVDFEGAWLALERAVQLICELSGGTPAAPAVDILASRPEQPEILCRFDRIRSLLGITIDNNGIMKILTSLGCRINGTGADACTVVPPSYRDDLYREVDLAEEVLRIYGLDKIEDKPVSSKSCAPIASDRYMAIQQWRDSLIALGFDECLHYTLVKDNSARRDPRFDLERDLVMLKNPLSNDQARLKPSLWGEMLETAERNISRRNLDLRLFEIGRAFCANPELFPEERLAAIILLTGSRYPERFGKEREELYTLEDLAGTVAAWFASRRIADWSFEPCDDPRFRKNHALAVKVDGKIIGNMGEVAEEFVESWRTTSPVFVAEVEMAPLFGAKLKEKVFVPFSEFPAVTRDVAMLVDSSITNARVVEFITSLRLPDFESVELFDLYADEKVLGAGRRSLAYRVTFRNNSKTLTDAAVNQAADKLRKELVNKLGVELR